MARRRWAAQTARDDGMGEYIRNEGIWCLLEAFSPLFLPLYNADPLAVSILTNKTHLPPSLSPSQLQNDDIPPLEHGGQ